MDVLSKKYLAVVSQISRIQSGDEKSSLGMKKLKQIRNELADQLGEEKVKELTGEDNE